MMFLNDVLALSLILWLLKPKNVRNIKTAVKWASNTKIFEPWYKTLDVQGMSYYYF